MKQLSFKLPEIDREKTKEAVEAALEKYRFYLLTVPDEKLPKMTANYNFDVPSVYTNEFRSSTETAVVDKVDFEREREAYIARIQRAVNRLNKRERELIIKRYLGNEETFDYQLYGEFGMSESSYYRFKARIFYKLAFILRIEVYKSDRKLTDK